MTPGARRRGGDGERIRFTVVATPLGQALVAATERGICMTALGDDRASLEAELHQRFPKAELVAADVAVRVCLSAMEVLGGLAIMQGDSPLEKWLRDCLSFMHSDGAQDSHRLRIANLTRQGLPSPLAGQVRVEG